MPSILSERWHRRISGSELITCPNSGDGAIFEFHEEFGPIAAKRLAAKARHDSTSPIRRKP